MAQLQLLTRFNISDSGKGCHIRVGDLDGDGRLEVLLCQPCSVSDERYFPHCVRFLAAYNLEGEKLWQVGTPDLENDLSTDNDIPVQIFDIDNDGNNEVLYATDEEFFILDGASGTVKKSYPLPDKSAHDVIIIADLEGKGYPQNIILKNRFHQLWAMDANFNVMWTYKGNIGRYPWPYDINGDGRDELIAGYSILSGDGDVIHTIDGESGHSRYTWVGDLYQSVSYGRAITVLGDKISILGTDLSLHRQMESNHCDIAMGNFIKGDVGTEICCTGEKTAILNSRGTVLNEFDAKSGAAVAVHNIDGSDLDMLLLHSGSSPAMLCDSGLNPIYTFSQCSKVLWADLFGDSVADIVLISGDNLEIYSMVHTELIPPAVPYFRPQPKRLYNYTRFAGEMEPSQYALAYITGSFSDKDLESWATNCTLGNDISADEIISRADFAVLLAEALDLKAYERENFTDVYPSDYFAKSVGILKKLAISEGVLGKFNPLAPMTAEQAVDMIKKAGYECVLMADGELTKKQAARIVLELLTR